MNRRDLILIESASGGRLAGNIRLIMLRRIGVIVGLVIAIIYFAQ